MEILSLQPMADQEIDQVSGGVLPLIAIAAFKVGGKIAAAAILTVVSNYIYHAAVKYFGKT